MTRPGIVIDGASLTCAAVAAVARDEAPVTVGADAVTAARAAWVLPAVPGGRAGVGSTSRGM